MKLELKEVCVVDKGWTRWGIRGVRNDGSQCRRGYLSLWTLENARMGTSEAPLPPGGRVGV